MLKSCGILAVVFSLLLPSLAVAMTPAEIVAANKDAVVFLHVEGTDRNGVPQEAIATGFLVSNTGHVITAKHIINDEHGNPLFDQYTVSGVVGTNVGFATPMEIRAREQDADVLLLQFRGNRTDYRTVTVCFGGTPPAEGDDLVAIGFPRGSDRSIIRGGLSNTSGSGGLWQTDTPFVYGYSGGPVFALDGRVLGIVAGGTEGVAGRNFFTPIHDANYLLNRLPQPPKACGVVSEGLPDELRYDTLQKLEFQVRRVDDEIWVQVNDRLVEHTVFGEVPPWRDVTGSFYAGSNKIQVDIYNSRYGGCGAELHFRVNERDHYLAKWSVPMQEAPAEAICATDVFTINLN